MPLSDALAGAGIRSVGALAQPRRNVALGMKHAPDVNMVFALDVEDQIGEAGEPAVAQIGNADNVGERGDPVRGCSPIAR